MIIVSACVAVVTTVIIDDSLERYAQQLEDGDEIIQISKERPDPVPGSYEEALSYVKAQAGDIGYITANNEITDMYEDDYVLRIAAVITSDGWMIINSNVGSPSNVDQLVAWIDGKKYNLDELVEGDSFDLVHLVDARGLTPFAFGSSDSIEEGERVFAFGARDIFYVTTLVDGQYVPTNGRPSPSLYAADYEQIAFWELQQTFDETLVVNSVGELVAITHSGDDNIAYPIHYALPWVGASIRGELHDAPRLGLVVEWLDVLFVNTVDRSSGALVHLAYGNDTVFQSDDIVIRIGGRSIDANTPIAEILLDYEVGDVVNVAFIRDGETQEADVELLGEDLLY